VSYSIQKGYIWIWKENNSFQRIYKIWYYISLPFLDNNKRDEQYYFQLSSLTRVKFIRKASRRKCFTWSLHFNWAKLSLALQTSEKTDSMCPVCKVLESGTGMQRVTGANHVWRASGCQCCIYSLNFLTTGSPHPTVSTVYHTTGVVYRKLIHFEHNFLMDMSFV
jgi:hypothetical protein